MIKAPHRPYSSLGIYEINNLQSIVLGILIIIGIAYIVMLMVKLIKLDPEKIDKHLLSRIDKCGFDGEFV